MSLLPQQCRAARALLGWSQVDLAAASKVATKTLADFERGHREPYERTLVDVRKALEEAGVIFLSADQMKPGGVGVRLRS